MGKHSHSHKKSHKKHDSCPPRAPRIAGKWAVCANLVLNEDPTTQPDLKDITNYTFVVDIDQNDQYVSIKYPVVPGFTTQEYYDLGIWTPIYLNGQFVDWELVVTKDLHNGYDKLFVSGLKHGRVTKLTGVFAETDFGSDDIGVATLEYTRIDCCDH